MGVDRGAAPIMDIDYYFLTATVFPKLNYILYVTTQGILALILLKNKK